MLRLPRRFASTLLKVENPYTFQTVAEIPYTTLEESYEFINKSNDFFKTWKLTSLDERISVLDKALLYFKENKQEIAKEITTQMGKPIRQSLQEVDNMIVFSNELKSLARDALSDEVIEDTENSYKKITKIPIGPVLILSDYTYPLMSIASGLVPAILSGNTAILKHSVYSPLCGTRFHEAFKHAGADYLVKDLMLQINEIPEFFGSPKLSYVHFTGKVESGKEIYKSLAEKNMIDIGLFLSGDNMIYISAEADLDKCAAEIGKKAMENAGQSCFNFKKLLIHRSVHDDFIERAQAQIMSLTMGDPMDEMTTLGPMADPDNMEFLQNMIQQAVANSSEVICGGSPTNDETGNGRFYEPTIITDLDDHDSLFIGEFIGPVLAISPVESDEEALSRFNNDPYLFASGIYSKDKSKAIEFINKIKGPRVLINECSIRHPRLPWNGSLKAGKGVMYSSHGYKPFYQLKSYSYTFG
ncbi:unnamed protein product [Blepharisma stoltei]|uniref:Aldehyde dehydrogenase domain-containing protein n=1 Tax=Blepharisma stoltei TaxID=1481888 RepID=A0AAU9ICV1_9CILI|nr:unnamed protein product [Blepharisma stoltei]